MCKLNEDDLEEIKLEKEHLESMKALRRMINCSCGYEPKGKGLKQKVDDMYNHTKMEHPEKRKFEL